MVKLFQHFRRDRNEIQNRRIEEYKLKNGIEDISIIFDEKYQLLTTFMSCDVLPFEKWIKSGFDRVLSGEVNMKK